jgi:hypothetical protein
VTLVTDLGRPWAVDCAFLVERAIDGLSRSVVACRHQVRAGAQRG